MPIITGPDASHITQVLRFKVGDIIGLFDGNGGEYEAEIMALTSEKVTVSIIRQGVSNRDPSVHITVAQGYLKEKKMDLVVRQLSEVGAMCWMPFRARRSVVSLDSRRMAARRKRWEKIAVEAAKQCGRNRVMAIEPARSYADVLKRALTCDQRIVFCGKAPRSLKDLAPRAKIDPVTGARIILILGPEGGFDPKELQLAKDSGFTAAGLGPRTLRAETAALVACSLLQYIFGDMGQQSP